MKVFSLKTKLSFFLIIIFMLSVNAQMFTPSGSIQGTTSGNNNVGIGTNIPSSSLHIKTPKADLVVENSGIEGASITINSGRYNRPAITFYNQLGTTYWSTGILYDETGNQKYSIGTTSDILSSKLLVQSNGNIGIGTINPQNKLQIGEFNNGGDSKLSIPGIYNFEEIKLGQYGNGASGLEMITHTGLVNSFGVRLFASTDTGTNGLLIQTADPSNSSNNLIYTTKLAVNLNGNVGVGTTNPTSKLTVAGNINAREVKVTVDAGADFVFEKDYDLPSLESVDNFIKENKHLPEIASAQEMQEDGINLSEMNIKLLQKIEEMTLYMIEQNKRIEKLENNQK